VLFSGYITTNRSFDREVRDHYELRVTASNKDNSMATGTATVSVTILDDNDESPRFTQRQYVFHVPEDRPTGTTVGHVTAVDRDLAPNNRHSYYVEASTEGGDDSNEEAMWMLGVERRTGRVYTRRPLDRERRQQYRLTLTVRDDDITTLTDTATVVVEVQDENDEDPVFRFPTPSNDSAVVMSQVAVGGRVACLVAVDLDAGENSMLRYSIRTGNEHSLFHIDPATGCISANGSLTPYVMETFRLVVSVEDSGTPSRSSSATLFVVVDDGTQLSAGSDSEPAGLVAQLLQLPMSGTRLVMIVGLLLGLCIIIVAVCVTVCACRLQRRHKLGSDTLKGTSVTRSRHQHSVHTTLITHRKITLKLFYSYCVLLGIMVYGLTIRLLASTPTVAIYSHEASCARPG